MRHDPDFKTALEVLLAVALLLILLAGWGRLAAGFQ